MPQSSPSEILTITALRFLSFRPRFKAEVENKLLLKAKEINADPTLINQIIADLEKSKFINDQQLLESYIRHHLTVKKKGPLWIKMHLSRFGLDKLTVSSALRQHAPDTLQMEIIAKIISKLTHGKKSDLSIKAKVFRHLAARGFTPNLIYRTFDGSIY